MIAFYNYASYPCEYSLYGPNSCVSFVTMLACVAVSSWLKATFFSSLVSIRYLARSSELLFEMPTFMKVSFKFEIETS